MSATPKMDTYNVIRFTTHSQPKIIYTGLTLEEAHEHILLGDSSGEGWFDGYEETNTNRDIREGI